MYTDVMTTRTQLVDAASELLWERGYSATSPAMIQRRAGAGQGSMYHHFAGKADLAAVAMHRTADRMRAEILAAARCRESAIDVLDTYLELERQPMLGCRLGRLVQDPDVVEQDSLSGIAAEFFTWLRGWIHDVLANGQRSGELADDFDPEDVATMVVAVVQGGYVVSRAERDADRYRSAVVGMSRMLHGLLAGER
jgi:AcrR family transcriptional regulator